MAPSAGDPINLAVHEHVDTRSLCMVVQIEINCLFGLELAGRENQDIPGPLLEQALDRADPLAAA